MPSQIKYLLPDNPIQKIAPSLKQRICAAQDNGLETCFSNAAEFCKKVLDDLKLNTSPPAELADMPVVRLAELRFPELKEFFFKLVLAGGVPEQAATLHSVNLAQRLQLVRAFPEPDSTIEFIENKVFEIVREFPKTAADIEKGKNPGDVLDPYILAATQYLLYGGNVELAVGATVSHKALMMIEGLLGHLHEDVVGRMRGNVRVPEPRGREQKDIDPECNPFPGADVLQPPTKDSEPLRFHQIKSKTGSAKGGDGIRLGEQLQKLQNLYGGEIYYDALIGNTLRGHRSRAGVEQAAEQVIVLVGEAAFRALTRSVIGPQLLLRVYQAAFLEVARKSGYRVDELSVAIVATFKERASEHGEGFLESILRTATEGDVKEQDNRAAPRRVRRGVPLPGLS